MSSMISSSAINICGGIFQHFIVVSELETQLYYDFVSLGSGQMDVLDVCALECCSAVTGLAKNILTYLFDP